MLKGKHRRVPTSCGQKKCAVGMQARASRLLLVATFACAEGDTDRGLALLPGEDAVAEETDAAFIERTRAVLTLFAAEDSAGLGDYLDIEFEWRRLRTQAQPVNRPPRLTEHTDYLPGFARGVPRIEPVQSGRWGVHRSGSHRVVVALSAAACDGPRECEYFHPGNHGLDTRR